jgi:hypothetical protein
LNNPSFEFRDDRVESLVIGIPCSLEERGDEFDRRRALNGGRYSRVKCPCAGSTRIVSWARRRGGVQFILNEVAEDVDGVE